MKHAPAKKGSKRKQAAEPQVAPSADAAVPAVPEALEQSVAVVEALEPVALAAASSGPVALASNSTVKDAVALKQTLLALKTSPDPIVLDGSAVERVDTATLQLLCAFVRERLGSDKEVSWHAPSAALREASKLLGLTELLCLPAEVAA
jgi:ABC-type transporter Mla MlaB component